MGPGAAQVVGTILALFLAKRTSRTFAGVATLLLAAVGCAMMLGIPSSNYKARYGGYVLVYQCKLTTLFRTIQDCQAANKADTNKSPSAFSS
jgi:hypothetical protein